MCGVVDGGIIDGLWGYEAGQSGVGDLFGWVVDNCVPERYAAEAERRGIGVHEYLTELAAAPTGGPARLAGPRLAQRQPIGARQSRAVRTDRRHDGDDGARGHLPGADGVDGLRGADDRRSVRRLRSAGRRVRRRRWSGEECLVDADLRRRPAAAAVADRVGAGPGAWFGDPRRGRRRCLPRRPGRLGGDGQVAASGVHADRRERRPLRRAVRRVHDVARLLRARCTTM